jgi:hypothetical protein
MILWSIISSNKANEAIKKLIVTMLNQSINRIGATELKEASSK